MNTRPDYNKPTDEDEATVRINASPYGAMLGIFFRQLSLMGGAITALWQFASARDIRGLFQFMATHEFIAFVILAISIVAFLYGYVREWLHKKVLLITAALNPHEIEIVGTLPGAVTPVSTTPAESLGQQ